MRTLRFSGAVSKDMPINKLPAERLFAVITDFSVRFQLVQVGFFTVQ
jgi:hypothetical protein